MKYKILVMKGYGLQFDSYLKLCRKQSGLSQKQLVNDLYIHDIDNFKYLDNCTLSKWERNFATPKASRQASIVKYFQERTGVSLPCWDGYSVDDVEEMLCRSGMQDLLGKSKELVLNFPSTVMSTDDLHIYELRNSEMLEKVININMDLDKYFNYDTTHFKSAQFKEWALHPSSSFFICEYKDEFFGLLFTLRLKQEVFDKIMNFEIQENELTTDDFASFNEMGCNHMISFFAMNKKAASRLFIRYYAHLIANQKVIAEVGYATMMSDTKKLMENINFQYYASTMISKELKLQMYRETLSNFLACENVVKTILFRDECSEENQ